MTLFFIVLWRELSKSFTSSGLLAGIAMSSALSSALSFFMGGFYESNQATLSSFFAFHPWLYLFILPLLSRSYFRLDRSSCEVKFFMVMPISILTLVLARFLSSWLLVAVALIFTLPMVWTVNYLGNPDNGLVASGYFASWLLAGALIAVCGCASAIAGTQYFASLLSFAACLFLLLCGLPNVMGHFLSLVDVSIIEQIYNISFLKFYTGISSGVLRVQEFLSFISLIVALLAIKVSVLKLKTQV